MAAIEGPLVLDAKRLHEFFGLRLDRWASVIGLEIDHVKFGMGQIQSISEGDSNGLRVSIAFPVGSKRLSSSNLGKNSLLVVRLGECIDSQIQAQLMTRDEIKKLKLRLAEEERQRAEEKRTADLEFAELRIREQQEEQTRLEQLNRLAARVYSSSSAVNLDVDSQLRLILEKVDKGVELQKNEVRYLKEKHDFGPLAFEAETL